MKRTYVTLNCSIAQIKVLSVPPTLVDSIKVRVQQIPTALLKYSGTLPKVQIPITSFNYPIDASISDPEFSVDIGWFFDNPDEISVFGVLTWQQHPWNRSYHCHTHFRKWRIHLPYSWLPLVQNDWRQADPVRTTWTSQPRRMTVVELSVSSTLASPNFCRYECRSWTTMKPFGRPDQTHAGYSELALLPTVPNIPPE